MMTKHQINEKSLIVSVSEGLFVFYLNELLRFGLKTNANK